MNLIIFELYIHQKLRKTYEFNQLQMDNYQYNDKLFEILDVADSNCSSSLVESLNHLVNFAQDETYGWKKITGKYILDNKVNNTL